MIQVFSYKNSSRLEYIAGILFRDLLGLDFRIQIIDADTDFEAVKTSRIPSLIYGALVPGFACIPSEGLLFEETIAKKNIRITTPAMVQVHFSDQVFHEYTALFDLFSAAFYLVTEYELYATETFDMHQRYQTNTSALFADINPLSGAKYYKSPILDQYALSLFAFLKTNYNGLQKKTRSFDYRISFDIDSPFLYRHKPALIVLGSVIKKVIRFKFNSLFRQIKALCGGKDPYDIFDEILETCPGDKLIFFFLISGKDPNDGRISYRNEAYRNLIRKIHKKGIQIGIHPSYNSFMDMEMVVNETRTLNNITGNANTTARMHFLKYRLPETFHHLSAAGITDDYTLCLPDDTGFKNFISIPVKWFDLSENKVSSLTLHPTMVMDRSLQKYMGLSPEAAWQSIKSAIDITKSYHGNFTILFHNSTLSETGEWKGWREVYEKTVQYLRSEYVRNNS